jgi:starvation-inducible DNA-binding protein
MRESRMRRCASAQPAGGNRNPFVDARRKSVMSASKAAANEDHAKQSRKVPLATPTDLKSNAIKDIAAAMNVLLSDVFSLYLKTKNFHWHMSGPHFRDYHLLLDEHGDQIFAMTDPIAERVRKIGGITIHSIGEIARKQRLKDNDADYVTPMDMLAELREDNRQLTTSMREVHELCDEHGDVATASLLEVWIDETERRTWFLFEIGRMEGSER